MLKSCWWVAHVIIVSAQVPLVLTLGLWDFGLGLDNSNAIIISLKSLGHFLFIYCSVVMKV